MKMESQIHIMFVDVVTKYFEKMLSHCQMMTSSSDDDSTFSQNIWSQHQAT